MLGTKLANRYEILREIGRGGMGVVYLAHDPVLEREVAIKVVLPGQVSPQSVERFKREARVVAKMDHRSIVSVHDSGEDQGSLFFVMPFVEGSNLRALLRTQAVTLGEVIEIGTQVASALDYSHSRGIIHRDIKPENIMVERDSGDEVRVRITDFGLAMAPSQDRLTKSATIVGTILYMSPEQVSGNELDSKSDIYSLATVLYESLTGQPPFSGEVQALIYRITNELPLPPRALQPQLDEEVEELLMRCLEKDPRKRPTGKELHDNLSKYRTNLVNSGRYITMLPTASALSLQYQRPAARPFVGRDKEFAELQRRLNAAMSGECQLVLVGGEAGIGKTRLLDELETLAKVRNVSVLHGRFAEIDRALPYQAYSDTIQEYFRNKPSSATPIDFSDLAGDLTSLFPVLAEIRELSSSSDAARSIKESHGVGLPARQGSKFEDRSYIFELLARTITRMAAGKTLVVLLEELHVADVSVEALDYIVRRLGPTPTLIVGTYRTTEVDKRHPIHKTISGFKGDKRFALLQLGPLTPSGHRLFLEKLMGGSGLDDALAIKFYEATEGNPYFTNELVRSLIDSGGIVQDDTGVYKLSSDAALSVEELPATIQQTVQERVERLPAEQREILSTASVLGKTFDFSELKMMAPDKADLENNLEQLLISGFLEEDRQSRGLRFTFSSGVLRDVLYGAVPRLRRRMLHRKYAEELEKQNEGRLERVYGSLFEHYSQADIPEKVIHFGFLLARKSLDALSPDDTIRILNTVLDFLEYSGGDDLTDNAEAKALLGSAYRIKGNHEDALRAFEEAIRIFEKLGLASKRLQAIRIAAETAWQARKVEESRRWVEKGIDLANSLNDEPALAKLLSLAATIANLRGDATKARAYLDQLEKLKPRSEAEQVTEGGTLSVALTSPFRSRHPVNTTLLEEIEVFLNAFETLVRTDEQGNLIPNLCERWEAIDQGAGFIFDLRKEVTFHDGNKLTAALLKTAIENAISACNHALPPGLAAIQELFVVSDYQIRIQLRERLPIYPALLTDSRTAIANGAPALAGISNAGALAPAPSELYGTGPFRIVSLKLEAVLLEKNKPYWKSKPPHLDALHFQVTNSLASMLEGFRSGKYDVVRELQPQDLEIILRERQTTFAEAPSKNVFFLLWNQSSPFFALRQALTSVIRTQDLVRSALGRLGQPANGLLPPGILGHDPGRRRYPVSIEKGKELMTASGISAPVRLRAGISPANSVRYGTLLDSLFKSWSELGVEVMNETPTMEAFLKTFTENQDIDLLFVRWISDYDDPDAFTYNLFHSGIGEFRKYFSSKELDDLMTAARLETNLTKREKLYRKIENDWMDSGVIFPLFYDVNYRLASPQVHHLALSNTAPFVNYSELTKDEKSVPTRATRTEYGIIRAPIMGRLFNLDPSALSIMLESLPITMIFETLTRAAEGARIIPWLASSFQTEQGGKRFRFHLRDGVRFQDGRRLTSRDVRYSFERTLMNQQSALRGYLSPILGAQSLLEGKSRELEGFHILSTQEFLIELERPLAFLPAMLSNASFAIVPEGLDDFHGSWREGVAGTGPFRVVSFEPDQFLKLETNPYYWRPGFPKTQNLEFSIRVPLTEVLSGFRSGKFSLAYLLETADLESLLHDTQSGTKYKEMPWLATYYLSFNSCAGLFSDEKIRKAVQESLDVEGMVRRTRRFAAPARTLTPPALLGYEPERPVHRPSRIKLDDLEVKVALSTLAKDAYGKHTEELFRTLRDLGIQLRVTDIPAERLQGQKHKSEDIILINWVADYPDADGVLYPLLHSTGGFWQNRSSTPEIDRLIEQERIETDPDVRHSLFRRIEEEIRKHALIIPLLHDQFHCFARPEVEGLELNYFFPFIAFDNLSIRR